MAHIEPAKLLKASSMEKSHELRMKSKALPAR
jgi:hypothetical protein